MRFIVSASIARETDQDAHPDRNAKGDERATFDLLGKATQGVVADSGGFFAEISRIPEGSGAVAKSFCDRAQRRDDDVTKIIGPSRYLSGSVVSDGFQAAFQRPHVTFKFAEGCSRVDRPPKH
jgi:hypothetical protein